MYKINIELNRVKEKVFIHLKWKLNFSHALVYLSYVKWFTIFQRKKLASISVNIF